MSELKMGGLTLSRFGVKSGISKFDLALLGAESETGLSMILEYSSDLFSAEKVAGIASHFKNLLEQLTQSPDTEVLDILLAPDEDKGRDVIFNLVEPPIVIEEGFQFE
jgi:hypothetical protein